MLEIKPNTVKNPDHDIDIERCQVKLKVSDWCVFFNVSFSCMTEWGGNAAHPLRALPTRRSIWRHCILRQKLATKKHPPIPVPFVSKSLNHSIKCTTKDLKCTTPQKIHFLTVVIWNCKSHPHCTMQTKTTTLTSYFDNVDTECLKFWSLSVFRQIFSTRGVVIPTYMKSQIVQSLFPLVFRLARIRS